MNDNNDKNIYRAFTFFNNRSTKANILPTNPGEGVSCYLTLGYFDKFMTQTINVNKTDHPNMLPLWEKINEMNEALVDKGNAVFGDESFQNIFGVSLEAEGSNEKSDAEFWGRCNKDNYAYTFIILVQFYCNNTDITLEEKINAYKKTFIKSVNENLDNYYDRFINPNEDDVPVLEILKGKRLDSDYILTDYLTYDRYDYILAVKANCYLPFVRAMQQLYSLNKEGGSEPIAIKSFTVTAVNSDSKKLIDEVVPSVCIECSYNESSIYSYKKETQKDFTVSNFLSHFSKEVIARQLYGDPDNDTHSLYYITGEDDFKIIAPKVRMSNLLPMIKNLTSEYLYGFSTTINVMHSNDVHIDYPKPLQEDSLIEDCIIKCKDMINLLENYPVELTKTLHQINNGLSALRPVNKEYRGYGFFSLYKDFMEFVSNLNCIDNLSSVKISKALEVTKAFGSALLTTIRSDFREFQIPTFNANLYYAPTKLLVFYRAFALKLLETYNEWNQYSKEHFVICIENEMTSSVQEKLAIEISDKATTRIFVCHMSEKNLYQIGDLMIQLNHEIAHFGMHKIRNREKRVKYIADSLIKAYLLIIRFRLATSLFSDSVEDRFKEFKDYILGGNFSKSFLNVFKTALLDGKEGILSNKNYFNDTIKRFEQKIKNEKSTFIRIANTNLLNSLEYDGAKNAESVYNNYDSISKAMKKAFEEADELTFKSASDKDVDSVVYFLEFGFKECFADAIAILTLKLSPKDYWRALTNASTNNSVGKNNKDLLFYRFCVVFDAFNNVEIDCETIRKWKEVDVSKSTDGFADIKKAIKKYKTKKRLDLFGDWNAAELHNVMGSVLSSGDEIISVLNLLNLDKDLYQNFVDYVCDCIKTFVDEEKIENCNNAYHPSEIYVGINNDNIPKQIFYLDKVLSDFERVYADECIRYSETIVLPKKQQENSTEREENSS